MRMWTTAALLLALAIALYLPGATARAQPEIVESDPQDGDVLPAPPEVLHLCFSEPAKIEDPQDFAFSVLAPGESPLGLRIVWQREGDCVDIYPGRAPGEVKGDWTFHWQVTSRANDQQGSGSFSFSVTGEGSPAPSPAASPVGGTPAPGATASPPPATDEDDGDGPDILFLALITAGSVVAAGVVGLVLYLVRLRIGFWLHRPPPRDGGEGPEHH